MRKIKLPPPKSDFWHLHAHSQFSAQDALGSVKDMVRTAQLLGQPALALTDHGNMAGSVQLYTHCKQAGIAPFPGEEFYFKQDAGDHKRYHIGITAFTTEGYEALVKLSSWSHTRARFHHKPHIDFTDMAEWSDRGWTQGLALTTGCFFGMVQQLLLTRGEQDAKYLIQTLANWFPHTYVELQHHYIDHEGDHAGTNDDDIVSSLASIADELGLPVVITQDAHYCTKDEKEAHETLKQLVSWGSDGDDAVFPGDSFHLADARFVRSHYNEALWERGLAGLRDLLSKHTLVIPELETYHYNVPMVMPDPEDWLERFTSETLILNPELDKPKYQDRWVEELQVVLDTNMAGYLALNSWICEWMREQGIFYETRGSASGSLLCYLLGITQLDPLKEGLRYERFLSRDRTKPPDIDLDVEDARRQEVIEFLSTQFNVCQIGTWANMGIDRESNRGSLFVAYLSRLRKDGTPPEVIGSLKTLSDLPFEDQKLLDELDRKGVYKAYGTHAGGLVVTTKQHEFERLVPTMLVASSDTTVTQYPMDDIEALGFLKEDILGQTSLTVIRRCFEMIGRDVLQGWDWMPMDDKQTFVEIRKQNVDGVFQLEGWTSKKGCRELKPRNLRDLTHLMALYRPAAMDSGLKDAYIQRRAKWEQVPDRHPILNACLKETHGVPVFQDQLVVLLRELGFSPDDLTKLLKAIKASNENIGGAAQVIESFRSQFVNLALAAGFNDSDTQFTWTALEGFAKYGFNKAHASTYARRAYRTAYLKTHHPLEFHAALLQTWAGTTKESQYILATKEAGIRLLKPHVNVSGDNWSIDHTEGAIRKGLVSIKGIGPKAAIEIAANAPFSSVQDLIDRCDARAVTGGKNWHKGELNGVLLKLHDAGALKGMT